MVKFDRCARLKVIKIRVAFERFVRNYVLKLNTYFTRSDDTNNTHTRKEIKFFACCFLFCFVFMCFFLLLGTDLQLTNENHNKI